MVLGPDAINMVRSKFASPRDEILVIVRGLDVPRPQRQSYPRYDCQFARDILSDGFKRVKQIIAENQPIRLVDVKPLFDIPGYPGRVGVEAEVWAGDIHVANKMISEGHGVDLIEGQPRKDWCE